MSPQLHITVTQSQAKPPLLGDMLVGSHILNDLETAEKWST
ncbi:hypothetical protein AB3S75_000868 [Citrus x aurantiifolia]